MTLCRHILRSCYLRNITALSSSVSHKCNIINATVLLNHSSQNITTDFARIARLCHNNAQAIDPPQEAITQDILNKSENPKETSSSVTEDQKTEDDIKQVKLFLRGLPFSITLMEISRFFDGIELLSVNICELPNRPGFRTGEAVVTVNPKDEKAALSKHLSYIGRRYVEISSLGVTSHIEEKRRINEVAQPDGKFILHLQGIPFNCTKQEILQFLSGIDVVAVKLPVDNIGRSLGRAIVTVDSEESRNQVLAKNREYIGSRYVQVIEHTPASSPSQTSLSQDDYSNAVTLRGLPFRVSQSDIYNFFGELKIDNVILHSDKFGRNNGLASVVFSNAADVSIALEKHMSYIGSRYIEVLPKSRF